MHIRRQTLRCGLTIFIAALVGTVLICLPGSHSSPAAAPNNKFLAGISKEKEPEHRYKLMINKLQLDTPIILNVNGSDIKAYLKALQYGVAQMQGTAEPGQQGNIVIFGHSSADQRYKGNYGRIFSKLDNLKPGDKITIDDLKTNRTTIYTVANKEIVPPNDTSLIQQNLGSRLTLITCWPVGSDKSRLIVWGI